jgi:hypothetical protein
LPLYCQVYLMQIWIVNPRHVHKKLYFVAKLHFVQGPVYLCLCISDQVCTSNPLYNSEKWQYSEDPSMSWSNPDKHPTAWLWTQHHQSQSAHPCPSSLPQKNPSNLTLIIQRADASVASDLFILWKGNKLFHAFTLDFVKSFTPKHQTHCWDLTVLVPHMEIFLTGSPYWMVSLTVLLSETNLSWIW